MESRMKSRKLWITLGANMVLAAMLGFKLIDADQYTLSMSVVNGGYMVGQGIADRAKNTKGESK